MTGSTALFIFVFISIASSQSSSSLRSADAFVVSSPRSCSGRVVAGVRPSADSFSAKSLNMVVPLDPVSLDIGIAVVSAAVGAASQLPRIQQLERELETARSALTKSEQAMVTKITDLEEKLFQMDKEYEAQTAKFKRQYDQKLKQDLERITDKIKTDYQFKLDIKVEEEKSKLLSEKLPDISTVTSGKEGELAELRLKQERINQANLQLEQALEQSALELERLQKAASQKRYWWSF